MPTEKVELQSHSPKRGCPEIKTLIYPTITQPCLSSVIRSIPLACMPYAIWGFDACEAVGDTKNRASTYHRQFCNLYRQ
jgi:hypothetical protein